eukprot:18132-Heterococcus_DN1.PRE.2
MHDDSAVQREHASSSCINVPSRCYTVSGNISSNTSSTQASIDCYSVPQDTTVTSRGAGGTDGCLVTVYKSSLTALAPQQSESGLAPASTAHTDAILDLKSVEAPIRMLLSSSRDGVVN